jgi:MFS family permease
VLLVTGGRLGDKYGRRRTFLIGLAGFTAASLACGLVDPIPCSIYMRLFVPGHASCHLAKRSVTWGMRVESA